MSENVIDLEMDDDEERRGVKRPPDDDNNFATIQMCVNCKQESDYFVPVSCCHVFCSDCYTQLFAELQPDSEARCPEDGKIIIPDFDTINNLSGGHEVVPKMRMPCRHKDRGCEKMVFFQEMKEHVDSCVFRLLNCPYNCKDKVIFKNLTDHLINHCECRLTKCNFCVDNIPLNTKKEHEDKCPNKPITCQYCNLENILLKEMAHHIENCPMSPSVCVMRRMGCSFEGTKKRTEEHQQDWPIHLQVLVNCLSSLQKDVHDLAARFDALDQNRLNAQAATESIPASQCKSTTEVETVTDVYPETDEENCVIEEEKDFSASRNDSWATCKVEITREDEHCGNEIDRQTMEESCVVEEQVSCLENDTADDKEQNAKNNSLPVGSIASDQDEKYDYTHNISSVGLLLEAMSSSDSDFGIMNTSLECTRDDWLSVNDRDKDVEKVQPRCPVVSSQVVKENIVLLPSNKRSKLTRRKDVLTQPLEKSGSNIETIPFLEYILSEKCLTKKDIREDLYRIREEELQAPVNVPIVGSSTKTPRPRIRPPKSVARSNVSGISKQIPRRESQRRKSMEETSHRTSPDGCKESQRSKSGEETNSTRKRREETSRKTSPDRCKESQRRKSREETSCRASPDICKKSQEKRREKKNSNRKTPVRAGVENICSPLDYGMTSMSMQIQCNGSMQIKQEPLPSRSAMLVTVDSESTSDDDDVEIIFMSLTGYWRCKICDSSNRHEFKCCLVCGSRSSF